MAVLLTGCIRACPQQPPQQSDSGDHLNQAVNAERDKCGAACNEAGADGNERLNHIPRNGEPFETYATSVQVLTANRYFGFSARDVN